MSNDSLFGRGKTQDQLASKHDTARGLREHEERLLLELKKTRETREKQAKQEEEQAANIHYMKCPHCGFDLKNEHIDEFDLTLPRCEHCQGIFVSAEQIKAIRKHFGVFSKLARFGSVFTGGTKNKK